MFFLFLILVLFFHGGESQEKMANFGQFKMIFHDSIIQIRSSEKLVWGSPLNGSPFLETGYARTNSSSLIAFGNYNVSEHFEFKTTNQTIETLEKKGDQVILGGSLSREDGISLATYNVTFSSIDNSSFGLTVSITPQKEVLLNRLLLHYECKRDESFHGLGHQYTYFNLRGRVVPVVVSEQGVGRGLEPITDYLNQNSNGAGGSWHTTYAPKPVYLTNYNRSLVLFSSDISFFDFTGSETVSLELWSLSFASEVIMTDSFADLIENVTQRTGRMNPLPGWTQKGAVVGVEGGQEFVEEKMSQMIDFGVPIVAAWIQDWVGLRHSYDGDRLIWNWELNPDQYPEWQRMVGEWATKGIRVTTYINPFFSDPTNLTTHYNHNFYQEGIENGYFVKKSDGSPYYMSSLSVEFCMLDLTNPAAVKWMKQIIIKNLLLNPKSSGFMCDFGEYLPFDAVLYSGEDPASYHNIYPQVWGEITADAIKEANLEDEIVFFMRSGFFSTSKTSLFWLGDQLMSWDSFDGMQSVVIGSLSSGLVGHSLQHSDIGGYNAELTLGPDMYYTRTYNMLKRWSELSAFGAALYRTHPGTAYLETPQVYDNEDIMTHFGYFAAIFANLSSYRMSLMQEAVQKGYPLIRPMALYYGFDSRVWEIVDQYLFGFDFLIAPIMEPYRVERKVYFPEGSQVWIELWTGKKFSSGGTEEIIFAPVGKPPVFYVEGSETGEALREFILTHSLG